MCIYSITNYYGRLGNHLLQICSTIIQGYNNTNKYHFNNHNIFEFKNMINNKEGVCKCNKIKLFNEQQLKFYGLSILKDSYKNHINIKSNNNNIIYDIGIHIRSGDIFSTIGHSHHRYLQPPLFFYEKIIHENKLKKIVIVYEDKNNIVINELIKRHKNNINIIFQSSTIINDIYTLSNCKELVISNGTFWLIPYFESNIIENIIIADYMKNNHWFDFDSNTKYTEIALPNYMKGHVWNNTIQQREIMMKYSC